MKRKKKIFLDDKLTFPFGLKLVTKAMSEQRDCYSRGNLYVSGFQLTEAVRKINGNITTLHEVLGIQDKNENGDHIFIGVEDAEENIEILDEKLEDLRRFSGDIIPKYSKIEKEGKIIKIEVNIDSQEVKEDGSSIHVDNIDSDKLDELIMQQIESPQTLNQMQSIKDLFWSMNTAISFYKNGLSKIKDCENVLNGFLSGNDEEIVKVIKILHDRFQKDHKDWTDGDFSDEDKEPINPLEKDEKEVIKVFTEDKKKFLDNINSYIKPEFFELFRDVLPPDFRDFSYDYVSWSNSDIGYGWYRNDSCWINLEIYTTSFWFSIASVSQGTKEILTKKISDLLCYLNKKYKEIEDKVNSLTEILAIKIPIMVYKIGIDDMIKLASIYCNIEFVNYDSIEVISEENLSKLDSFKYYIDSQCRIIIITTKGEFYKFIPNISIQEIKSPTFEDHIKTSLEQKVNKEFELLKGKTLEYFNKILSEPIQLDDSMQDQLKKNPDYMDLLERTIDAKLELKYVTEKIPDNMKELYVKTDWYMYQYLQGEATNGVLKQSL